MKLLWIITIILIVNASTEITCHSDNDCGSLNSCEGSKCVHKNLIPLALIEYIGTFIMLFVSCIANAGGIGGSSITISLMLLLFRFDAHGAVANTQVFIFAGTLAATSLKIKDRHPTRDRPLIYYDILMPVIGPIILGVSVGVMINPMFPEWLILSLLTLLVTFLLWDIIGRAKKIVNKERAAYKISVRENLIEEDDEKAEEEIKTNLTSYWFEALSQNTVFIESQNFSVRTARNVENKTVSVIGNGPVNQSKNDSKSKVSPEEISSLISKNQAKSQFESEYFIKVQDIYKQEKRIIAWIPLTYFILLACISMTFTMLRVNRQLSGIKSCTELDFTLTAGYVILMFFMMFFASAYLVRKTSICEKGGYDFDDGDIHWTYHKCVRMCLFGVLTGLIVGLLGMGGGNIIGPLLLSLGVRPEISTISSSFSIFISSGIAAAQFFISGDVDIYYAAWFFGVSIIGSINGICILRKIAIKRNRVSVLVICIGVILFLSLLIIPTVGTMNAIDQNNQGVLQIGFTSIC